MWGDLHELRNSHCELIYTLDRGTTIANKTITDGPPPPCVVTSRVVRSENYPHSNEVPVVVDEAIEYLRSPREY